MPSMSTSHEGLVQWVVRWCARPHMYLPRPSDRGKPDINNLWLLINGYLAAGSDRANQEWMD